MLQVWPGALLLSAACTVSAALSISTRVDRVESRLSEYKTPRDVAMASCIGSSSEKSLQMYGFRMECC